MAEPTERVNTPISTAELERRWKAVRAAMERDGVDVLVMQNNNDHMGGYVKYFTDIPAGNGYPVTVVFPRDDLMTVVMQGPLGGVETPLPSDAVRRGVKRVLTTPSYASAMYTNEYDPELAASALIRFGNATIGLVCTYQMSLALGESLKRRLPAARFVDASDLVDRIKGIKSEEEMERIVATARMQDGAPVTPERVKRWVADEVSKLRAVGPGGGQSRLEDAAALFEKVALSRTFTEFLTIPAYEVLE